MYKYFSWLLLLNVIESLLMEPEKMRWPIKEALIVYCMDHQFRAAKSGCTDAVRSHYAFSESAMMRSLIRVKSFICLQIGPDCIQEMGAQ